MMHDDNLAGFWNLSEDLAAINKLPILILFQKLYYEF
jgi:hypothetical protein